MTIAHAESYLARLREESAAREVPTKDRALRLYERAAWSLLYVRDSPPCAPGNISVAEWRRLLVRIYDESIRLRTIAEGRR